jgi:hypothetical protein
VTVTEYILIDSSGEENSVFLSQVSSDWFRLEASRGMFILGLDVDEIPDDAGIGWLIKVARLDETRLRLLELRADPDVQTLSHVLPPRGFLESHHFGEFCEQIMTLGGNWELIMGGVFSAWIPQATSGEESSGLDDALNSAVGRWADEERSAGKTTERGT